MVNTQIFIGGNSNTQKFIQGKYANRHGLIAGSTGTGKTITLQSLIEEFSLNGIPCFATDIKGDLSGIAKPNTNPDKMQKFADKSGMSSYSAKSFPVKFWDVYADEGERISVTVDNFDIDMFAQLLELSPAQSDVLFIVWQLCRDKGFKMLDLEDLRSVLKYMNDNLDYINEMYGLVGQQSISGINRAIMRIKNDGADSFIQFPSFDILRMIETSGTMGLVNILSAERLYHKPRLYSMLVTWLLMQLFHRLPERGDADKPVLVFFFDEAHLLFKDASPTLLDTIERVVRLIRSKGVGIYFVTQSPTDVPEVILGQLGNRIQHALRAFTPKDQRAVRTAAETFRTDHSFDVFDRITTLGVGQALVSTLDESGIPSYVEAVNIRPPMSKIGPISKEEKQ